MNLIEVANSNQWGTFKKELDIITGESGLANQNGYSYNSTTKTYFKQ